MTTRISPAFLLVNYLHPYSPVDIRKVPGLQCLEMIPTFRSTSSSNVPCGYENDACCMPLPPKKGATYSWLAHRHGARMTAATLAPDRN